MGRLFLLDLPDGSRYCCRYCSTALALERDLLSKAFHSKNGPAWLFNACVNVLAGAPEERLMTTGMHVVADIACAKCLSVVGWKYEAAEDPAQKYKEGKFILERVHMSASPGPGSAPGPGPSRLRVLSGPSVGQAYQDDEDDEAY